MKSYRVPLSRKKKGGRVQKFFWYGILLCFKFPRSAIFIKTEESEKIVKFNGKLWDKKVYCEEYRKEFPYISDLDMEEENIIEIEY